LADAESLEQGVDGAAKNIAVLQDDAGRQITLEIGEASLEQLVKFIVRAGGKAAVSSPRPPEDDIYVEPLPQEDAPAQERPEEAQPEDSGDEEVIGSPFPPRRG
jgi:hypothetical protein